MNLRFLAGSALPIGLGSVLVLFGQSSEPIGFVNRVEGRCWIQMSSSNRRTFAAHNGVSLSVGDKVRCDEGGKLVLKLQPKDSSGGLTTVDPSPQNRWTTIPRPAPKITSNLGDPFSDWFKLAGAPRAASLAWVYSPPSSPGGAVWPNEFVLRWIPQARSGSISMSIQDGSSRQIWPDVKGQRVSAPTVGGELASPELREALKAYRNEGGNGPLTLILVNPEGDESTVKFSVITKDQEASLMGQLTACDGQDGLMRFICRAYWFRQIGLYTESAAEYDAALTELAPDSTEVMLHAIAAHRLTGNYQREEILTHQLPADVKAVQ